MSIDWGLEANLTSPVKWARFGSISRICSSVLSTASPSVLVISLPRSGSSWVGEALGSSQSSLYLREPLSQSDPKFHELGTVFQVNNTELDSRYRVLADQAFGGHPNFSPRVIRFPDQWKIRTRLKRQVVVKEVNPLACAWYAKNYHPIIIFLLRHPAAVALSWETHKWIGTDPGSWAANGRFQAEVTKTALEGLKNYGAYRVVCYEDLCLSPITGFKQLYKFAGLTWSDSSEQFISARICGEDPANEWATSRKSLDMVSSWKERVNPECLEALRVEYSKLNLPFYSGANPQSADWSLGHRI